MSGIDYKEIDEYLDNKITLDETIQKINIGLINIQGGKILGF